MKHNIGLVGCGKWSRVIIKEIERNTNFILKGIACKNNIDLIKNSKIKIYENYEDLINDSEISCLYVAKNPKTNYDLFLNLTNNIPIIFEKPISDSFDKANKIYNFSLSKKISIMTNLPNIYSDTFSVTKTFFEKHLKS